MGLSHDVTLPRDHSPAFPDRCVACGITTPDHTLRYSQRTSSWANLLIFIPGRKHSVDVPICRDCLDPTRQQRTVRDAVSWFILIAGVAAGIAVFAFLPRSVRKWAAIGFAVACFIPYIVWLIFRPPAFDLSVSRDAVDYEFENYEFAAEFAELNGKDENDIE